MHAEWRTIPNDGLDTQVINDAEFSDPQSGLLAARGFDARGDRSGGITTPVPITIKSGQTLVRFHGNPDGGWWFTPFELALLLDHLGHDDVTTGRSSGTGVLHKAGVVLRSWSGMESFRIATFTADFGAYFGEGDGAYAERPDGSKVYVKGLRILDHGGRQRFVRQVYVPGLRNHAGSVRTVRSGDTEANFVTALRSLPHSPLPFEA
jgi:hypothetical protein